MCLDNSNICFVIIQQQLNDLLRDTSPGEVGDDMSVPRARKNGTAPKKGCLSESFEVKGETQNNNQEEKNEEI